MKADRNLRIVGSGSILLLIAGLATVISRARTTAPASASQPPEVLVTAVQQCGVPIEDEWIGTLAGSAMTTACAA